MLRPYDLTRFLLLLTLAVPLFADDVTDSRRHYQAADERYKAKDYGEFAKQVRLAAALRPQHPTLLYRVAAAEALTGNRDAALAALERAAAMGMVYEPAASEDFASLRGDPRFQAVVARFAKNGTATGNAKVAWTLGEKGIIPEGLAWDAKTKRFFVSSVRKGTIHRGKELFYDGPDGWGIFGMAVDARRRVLWAATNAEATKKAAVLKLDADSGKLLARYEAPDDGEHNFGDLLVAGEELFLSDSGSPRIYVLRDGKVVPWLAGAFHSLQGLAATKDILYVADYSLGILAIDRRTRDVVPVRVPADVTLLGVDGLYLVDGRTLVATQNGVNPNRVIRIDLASPLEVKGVTTLAANLPRMLDPTLGVLAGGRFYFHANAQWERAEGVEAVEHVVMSSGVR